MAERLHHRIIWTWKVYIFLEGHVEVLLEGNSALCYSNTEIFCLAEKVSKLQKLLSAKRLYHREISLCVYPGKARSAFWVLWQAGQWAQCVAGCISETDGMTGLESCPSRLNCCNGTESVKPWRGEVCRRGSASLVTDWLCKPAWKAMIIVPGNTGSIAGMGSVYDCCWVFYIRQMRVSVYSAEMSLFCLNLSGTPHWPIVLFSAVILFTDAYLKKLD